MTDFEPYPEIEDSDFYKIIYTKEEFHKTKGGNTYFKMKTPAEREQLTRETCNPTKFNLQNYQEFVRNYISRQTHYNGILTFYGTGAGKTCASIQVAEGLKDVVHKLGKKIYVLSKAQIRPNFTREIYSFKKEKQEATPGSLQCTGDTYFLPYSEEKDPARRERKIKAEYRQYYEFFGIAEFANYVDTEVIPQVGKDHLGDFFSNSVFIIDEAQGLAGESKLRTEAKTKKTEEVPPPTSVRTAGVPRRKPVKAKKITERGILAILHEILGKSQGIKLILLTATPMRDNASQLVDILDLLLINDKRSPVDKKRLFPHFDEEHGLYEVNEAYLAELSKGYVSYVRGEHPISFPQPFDPRPEDFPDLPPPQLYIPHPVFDEDNYVLSDNDWIKHQSLVRCPMSSYQFANYRQIVGRVSGQEIGDKRESVDQRGRQASNIIFPVSSNVKDGESGNKAFEKAFEIYKEPSKITGKTSTGKNLTTPSTTQYKYRSFNQGFLDLSQIGKYSTKFATFLHQLIKSQGVIFAFTNWIESGARPLALMLEANGYEHYRSGHKTNLLYFADESLRPHRCAICGQFKSDPRHLRKTKTINTPISVHAIGDHVFKQAYYILLTGEETRSFDEEIEVVNSDENLDASQIKIVIGTQVSGEGLDFKRIREVHIIDPWHNNTRLYQVIGRAVRHCSHVKLPPEDRTVKIFRYSAAPPQLLYNPKVESYISTMSKKGQDQLIKAIPTDLTEGFAYTYHDLLTETSDEKLYRRVERKDLFVKKVERILKINAVDCQLNRAINHFPTDRDGSRECDYTTCQYTCSGGVGNINDTSPDFHTNRDTYNLYFSEPQILNAQRIIFDIFRFQFALALPELVTLVKEIDPTLETPYIYEAVSRVVGRPPSQTPMKLLDQYNRTGHLIFSKPYYIFQPDDLVDPKAPLYYRTTPLTIKKRFLKLDTLQALPQPPPQTILLPPTPGIVPPTPQPSQVSSLQEIIDNLVKISQKDSGRYRVFARLDRLDSKTQMSVFEAIIYANHPNEIKIPMIDFFRSKNLLYWEVDSKTNKPHYLGHIIDGTTRLYRQGKWQTVSDRDPEIENMKVIREMIPKPLPRVESDLRGFLQYDTTKKVYEFHVYDHSKKKIQMTKAKITKQGIKQKQSGKTALKGPVCGNITKVDLESYAKQLGVTFPLMSTKESLCELLELKFREKEDKMDEGKTWFYHEDPR